jgi:hypothetical protein
MYAISENVIARLVVRAEAISPLAIMEIASAKKTCVDTLE